MWWHCDDIEADGTLFATFASVFYFRSTKQAQPMRRQAISYTSISSFKWIYAFISMLAHEASSVWDVEPASKQRNQWVVDLLASLTAVAVMRFVCLVIWLWTIISISRKKRQLGGCWWPGIYLVLNYLHPSWGCSSGMLHITLTSQWTRYRLKSPASPLFTQPFIRAQIKENIKAPRHWPLCVEFTGDRWIPRTNGQLRGKCFHLMTSSWI